MLLFCFNYSSVSLENETIHFASGNTAWHQFPLQKCSCTICLTKGHHLNFITVAEYKLMPILHSSRFHSNTDYLGTQPLIKKQSPSPSWRQMCHVTKFLPTEFEQKWRMQLSRHLRKGKLLGLVVVLFPFLWATNDDDWTTWKLGVRYGGGTTSLGVWLISCTRAANYVWEIILYESL